MTDSDPRVRTPGETPRRVALLTTVDQLLSSVSNALLLFTVAQTASLSEFGITALLVAVSAGWMAFNRGALGAPVLLVSNLAIDEIRAEAGYAMTWAAGSGAVAGATVGVVGIIAGEPQVAVVFAAAIPAVLVQDVLRFAAIACEKPFIAVLSDGLWTILIGAAFLANIGGASIPASYAVALWGTSGLLAALVLACAVGIRPRFFRIRAWWGTYARARLHYGAGDALSPVYTLAVLFAVTLILDSSVAGTLRGAAALFGPIALLFSALPLVLVPHARREMTTAQRQWQILVKMSWISSGLIAVATAAAVAVPHTWGTAIMGSTWVSAVAVMPYEGLAGVAAIWMASVYVFLKMQGESRAAFWTRLVQVIAQLAGCIVAAFVFGTAIAIAASSAVLCCGVVAASVVVARRVAASSPATVSGLDGANSGVRSDPRHEDVATPAMANRALRPWPEIDVLQTRTTGSRP